MPTYTVYPPMSAGIKYGWCNVQVNILGKVVVGITKVSYSQEMEKENVYGAGTQVIGRGYGNNVPEASIEIYKEELEQLKKLIPTHNLYDIPPFDIVVAYTPDGLSVTRDVLKNCEFRNNGKLDISQNDKSVKLEMELILSHIEYGVTPV